GIGIAQRVEIVRRDNAVGQPYIGQEQLVDVARVDRLDHLGLARPQGDRLAIGRRDLRQSGAPGAAADHAYPHAFTPAPRTFSASGSSGQRGRAAMSSGSVRPAAKRSAPAQAIIAALSVQSHAGGTLKRRALRCARSATAEPIASLAAAPPATTTAGASVLPNASAVRSTRQSTTACWKLAAMSSPLC